MSYYRTQYRPQVGLGGHVTPGIKALLIANVGVFALQVLGQQIQPGWDMVRVFGLSSELVLHKHYLWQLVTYMFLHAPEPAGWRGPLRPPGRDALRLPVSKAGMEAEAVLERSPLEVAPPALPGDAPRRRELPLPLSVARPCQLQSDWRKEAAIASPSPSAICAGSRMRSRPLPPPLWKSTRPAALMSAAGTI